jgi:abnormal spindle-like microcephaly-associated protein
MFQEMFMVGNHTSLDNYLRKYIDMKVLLYKKIVESGLDGQDRESLNNDLNKKSLIIILSLIWFLDKLKMNNILKFCNSLFVCGSIITSSKAFLNIFCKDYMVNPDKSIKLLTKLDLEYTVLPIDTYNYKITNFAEDFRDGVKLTRVAEIILRDDFRRASAKLTLPASSRPARISNMKIALEELGHAGVCVKDIKETDLVDGNIYLTIKLLWNIFRVAELPQLSAVTISEEILEINGSNLKRFRDIRVSRYNLDIISNLLQWVCSVCAVYDIEVKDFDRSFDDGRIYGCLIHYYRPQLLEIKEVFANGDLYREFIYSKQLEEAQKYRKRNHDIIFKAIQEIQFVPWIISMIQESDKVIITFTAYLCERLITLKKGNDTSTLLTSLTEKISLFMNFTND